LAATVLGCGDSSALQRVAITDSAGIGVVENGFRADFRLPVWHTDTAPALRIAQHPGSRSEEFVGITGLVRLPEGGVIVADASLTLRQFGADGRFVRRIGGAGNGPGEFRTISRLGILGSDSLIIWDHALRRFTVLPLDGLSPLVFPGPAVSGFVFIVDFAPDGSALGIQVPSLVLGDMVAGTTIRPPVEILRIMPSTTRVDTVARLLGSKSYIAPGRHSMVLSVPFSPNPQCVADGRMVHCGVGDQFQILTYSAEGRLYRIVRLKVDNRPLPRWAISKYVEQRVEHSRSPEARAELREVYSILPYPDRLPAFDGLIVDSERNLWVMDYVLPGDRLTRWHVFDREGRLVALVELPADFTVFAASAREVLGVARDSLDVEQVQILRIRKSEPAEAATAY